MRSIIFASNNQNKADEIRHIVGSGFHIFTLLDAGINIDIPEPYQTLEENAREKSSAIYALTGKNCFSEDTGLEVFELNNEPGVRSARYAGNGHDFKKNTEKLLLNLKAIKNRSARFRTVISLMIDGREFSFEGICQGEIAMEEKGKNGFGYDNIFIPQGSTKTFAEMTMEEKNHFSHRKQATAKLATFLKEYGTDKN